MFKIDIGVYLIMVYDPDILFNQGYYDLIDVVLPPKSLVQPEYPAPLSNRSHTLARKYDVISGALGQSTPELSTAASFGSSPHFLFSGNDGFGRFFHLVEILYGGLPGRPLDDGIDGHSWWPQFENVPSEYLESYYPLRVEKYHYAIDSGGAGYHRGGNGIEKWYRFLAPGSVSLHGRSPPLPTLGTRGRQARRRLQQDPDPRRRELRTRPREDRQPPGRGRRSARLRHRRAAGAGGIRWSGRTTRWAPICGVGWSAPTRRIGTTEPSSATAASTSTSTRPTCCGKG